MGMPVIELEFWSQSAKTGRSEAWGLAYFLII